MNGIKTLFTIFTLTTVVLFSPTSHPEDSITKADIDALVQGNTRFAFDLYAELRKQKGDLFFSPYSISVLHAMIYAGARGNTEKQISDVFHFTLDPKKLHTAFHSVQLKLKSAQKKRGIELKDLSAIFVQRGYKVLKEYLDTLGNNYKPVLFYANFSRERTKVRDKINEWVARHTRLRIEDLVKDDDLSTMTRMILVNAIYFKGNWQYPFDKSATKKMRFWQARNKVIYVPMMFQEERLRYMENEKLQMLELPYDGKDLSMIIILPKRGDGLQKIEEILSATTFNDWINSLELAPVAVYLPRF